MSTPRTEDGGQPSDRPPARPVWVRVAFVVAGAIALLLLVAALAGGHGPRRHFGAASGRVSTASVAVGLAA